MIDIKYQNAFTEVLEILKSISKEDYDKIPNEEISVFEENKNKDYDFKYNPNKTLKEQNVSKEAKYIIAILFRDYWATPEQKAKIIKKEKQDEILTESKNLDKFDSNLIFKKQSSKMIEDKEKVQSDRQITVYKKSLLEKIKEKVLKTLKASKIFK